MFGGTKAADEGAILLDQIRLVQGQRDVASSRSSSSSAAGTTHITASAYWLLGGGLEDKGDNRQAAEAYRLGPEPNSISRRRSF